MNAQTTIVIPAYNEEQDLPSLLLRIEQSLSGRENYRVLIIDDGSRDRTPLIAEEAARRMPVELVRHSHNQGLGAAIRTGLRIASQEEGTIVTMDADNSQDPALIPALTRLTERGFDCVIASRFQPGAKEVGVPPLRVFLSHCSSASMRIIARYPGARDYTCGFRAYRVDAIRRLVDVFGEEGFLRENGFACMLELLLNLRAVHASVAEVPMVLRYDLKTGASKMRVLRTISRYAVTLARASWSGIRMRRSQAALARSRTPSSPAS